MLSIERTKLYSEKFSGLKYKKLGKTGLTVSICGFGCYRIDQGINQHKSALEFALKNGINLIDTSANYSDGRSEVLIGQVLSNLFASQDINREEIVVVTKGGYIQGENLKAASEKEAKGNPYNDVVKCSPDLWHCIDPKFLEDQITLSLNRLKLKKIDAYLLHNPEYFLTCSGIHSDKDRKREYYNRIKRAFVCLEKEVGKGRISFYGISSNTLVAKAGKINYTSLEKVIEAANEVSSENHFSVIQLPFNLIERGGLINKNQEDNTKSVLEFASDMNLGVLINRPLNAIVNNKVTRLADFEVKEIRAENEIKDLITDLDLQEYYLKKEYVDNSGFTSSEKRNLYDCLSLSTILLDSYSKFESPNHFQEIKGYYIIPRANYALSLLLAKWENDKELISLVKKYAVTTNSLINSVESDLAVKHNKNNEKHHHGIDKFLTGEQVKLSLSQKSILMINSLPEVSCTLVGMRNTDYVKDVIGSIESNYVESVKNYWRNV